MNEKEQIARFSRLKIKKFLRISINDFIKVGHAQKAFNLSENEAKKLMKDLEQLGYISYLPKLYAWTNTFQGDLLAHQPVRRKIKRKEAEAIIEDIFQRIHIANDSDQYLWQVHFAFVYGDFIDKKQNELRDLSIGIVVSKKNKDTYDDMAFRKANESKKAIHSILDVYEEPYNELVRFLKNQRHNVHLIRITDPNSFKNQDIEIIYKI